MKNFSGVCQAAGADKPLRALFIWITNIVTLSVSTKNKKEPLPKSSFMLGLSGSLLNDYKYLKVARRYKSGEVQL